MQLSLSDKEFVQRGGESGGPRAPDIATIESRCSLMLLQAEIHNAQFTNLLTRELKAQHGGKHELLNCFDICAKL